MAPYYVVRAIYGRLWYWAAYSGILRGQLYEEVAARRAVEASPLGAALSELFELGPAPFDWDSGRVRRVRPRRDIARHVIDNTHSCPRFLSQTPSYDVASNIWQALSAGDAQGGDPGLGDVRARGARVAAGAHTRPLLTST